MHTHSNKGAESKSNAVANNLPREGVDAMLSPPSASGQPEAVMQTKLQEIAMNSPQAKQFGNYQAMANNRSASATQRKEDQEKEAPLQGKSEPVQKKENKTGLPDNLKSGIEHLSGMAMDDVKVHYNSGKPAQLEALAYARGTEIHVAPGQEKHLPHEAWHVVQQKQGRVTPTIQMKEGVGINDDKGLENEADRMGAKAAQLKAGPQASSKKILSKGIPVQFNSPVQRYIGIEAELTVPVSQDLGGATADQRIRDFLSNGTPYNTLLAAPANGYKKTTDHDQLGKAVISGVQHQMDAAVLAKGFAGIPAPADYLGNIEYVTDQGAAPVAFDEETSASLKNFRASVKHMANDMNATVAKAKANVHPIGGGFQYGVPPVADWQNFCLANNLLAATGTAIHQNIVQNISDRLYVQVTAGITPRKIAAHLNRLGGDPRMAKLEEQYGPGAAERAWVSLITTDAVTAATAAINAINANLPGGTPALAANIINSSSLKGFVSLIMSYIFGFYHTWRRVQGGAGALGKNVVASLSKVPLNQVQLELDAAKRPDQWLAAQRNTLEAQIIAVAINRLNGAPANRVGADDANVNAIITFNWQTAWLPQVLLGNAGGDPFFAVAGVNPIAPADHAQSKAINTGPGRAARNPGGQERGGAIPMELRLIQEHPTPNQLLDLTNRAIRHVRKTHGHWW